MRAVTTILLCSICCLVNPLTSGQGSLAHAALPTSFTARMTLNLCPEYPLGGVTLEVHYQIGNDPTAYTANVLATTINSGNNTATVDISLPANYGTTDFHVTAHCIRDAKASFASNALAISNCDAIALKDTDQDGIPNHLEDLNCDNFFSPGDASNPDNLDSDGDGIRDYIEVLSGTDPVSMGSSPRPMILTSGVFDPDSNSNANPVVWRKASGHWFIRDYGSLGNHIAVQYGLPGDVPFTYQSPGAPSDFGVVRRSGLNYVWLFHGPGFQRADSSRVTSLTFGLFGDVLIPGPWEVAGVTSPAVARLYQGAWSFYIYQRDGSLRHSMWGGNGDIPKVQDYDGDGLFDIAVYRPTEQITYIIRSSDLGVNVFNFGSGTAELNVKGDYTGDGIDDISYWEPITGTFYSLKSDLGFNPALAELNDPNYLQSMQLGLYFVHVPLNWNFQNGRLHYSVVDHQTGYRFIRPDNNAGAAPVATQWGLPGDAHG